MKQQTKAKLKYLFFHFDKFSPDTFTFAGKIYRITDKKSLKKLGTHSVSLFLIALQPVILGFSVFKNIFYYALILVAIFFFTVDYLKLPKDIFQYLEEA